MSYEPEDVPCLIHTALRKCCDSDFTTLAYAIIHALQDSAWVSFCADIQKYAKEGNISNVDVFRRALSAMRDNMPKDMGVRSIMLVFQMFSTQDLEGALSFLAE